MKNDFLPYGRHAIDDEDVAAVVAVLRSDWLTSGPVNASFEKAFAKQVEAKYAVSCASGTAALHLAMLALGIGPGDAVVVPALTFLASANCVRYVGAEVIFSDVDPATGLMGPKHLETALASANPGRGIPKAVIPVHLNGQCGDLAEIAQIARSYGMKIVEDACHALGAVDADGERIGSTRHSDLACFSLHPVKALTMGEGGVVTGSDAALLERVARLRNHGINRNPDTFEHRNLALDAKGGANPWYYEMPELGLNYRASDIQCALGLSQLAKLERFVDRRLEIVASYDKKLAHLAPRVRPIARTPGVRAGWHLYPVHVDFAAAETDRAALMQALRERNIGTQVHYLPVNHQPYYTRRYGETRLPGAERYYAGILSLPLYPAMEDGDVDRVAEALGKLLGL